MDADREDVASGRDHVRIQGLLRAGLGLSVLLMLAGLGLRAVRGDVAAPAVGLFEIVELRDPARILTSSGILVLALTPAFRVLALAAMWWKERDWRFVGVALAVSVTLALAIIAGREG